MNTTLTVGTRLSVLFFILLFYSTAFAGSAKVNVCHIPPDNPENFHTIRINEKALPTHLSHGDFASACSDQCKTLCDDGNACTVDDTMDCEELGCPTSPREPVDCDDGLACTADSCDVVAGCVNEDLCVPTDLCHVSICSVEDGECAETPKECGTGEICDVGTGECIVDCPCFTLGELVDAGTVDQCGNNFEGFPDMAGAIYFNGNVACSGVGCVEPIPTGIVSCIHLATGKQKSDLLPVEDASCRSLILANCEFPNQPASGDMQSSPVAEGAAFIDQ